MIAILAVLMLPAVATIAPLFVLLTRFQVGDFTLGRTMAGVMVAITASTLPFAIWNLKGYLDTIPRELEEAASVDGATRNQSFIRIILPLALPALAVTGFLGFIAGWTEYYFSMIFLSDAKQFTLAVALNGMVGQYSTPDALVGVQRLRDHVRAAGLDRVPVPPEVHHRRPRHRRRQGLGVRRPTGPGAALRSESQHQVLVRAERPDPPGIDATVRGDGGRGEVDRRPAQHRRDGRAPRTTVRPAPTGRRRTRVRRRRSR